jgi:hypothetical protein
VGKTSAAAVPYKEKSHHSIAVPIALATTARRRCPTPLPDSECALDHPTPHRVVALVIITPTSRSVRPVSALGLGHLHEQHEVFDVGKRSGTSRVSRVGALDNRPGPVRQQPQALPRHRCGQHLTVTKPGERTNLRHPCPLPYFREAAGHRRGVLCLSGYLPAIVLILQAQAKTPQPRLYPVAYTRSLADPWAARRRRVHAGLRTGNQAIARGDLVYCQVTGGNWW